MRNERGWSRETVAGKAGTSQQQIQKLETGQRPIDLAWAQRIAKAFGCSPAEIGFTAGVVPLVGAVRKGLRIEMFDEPKGKIATGVEVSADTVALELTDDAGASLGQYLLYDKSYQRELVHADFKHNGRTDMLVVRANHRPLLLREVSRETQDHRYRLTGPAGIEPIRNVGIVWVSDIIGSYFATPVTWE